MTPPVDTRQRLPNRRPCVAFPFSWRNVEFIGSLGFDRMLQPREIFVSCSKTTTEFEAVARDAAVILSLLLQRGGTFDECRVAITRGEDGGAASLVGQLLDEIEKIEPGEVAALMRVQ